MHANQTDIQKILGGVQQYVIPLFQRPYSWEDRQWKILWEDLQDLCEDSQGRNHFIGSIVTMPERSYPEGVSKFVLIDGQQRLTTILILLAAIRDKARSADDRRLADKIDDLMLKNRHQDDHDVYKLLPTQADRQAFCAIMDGRPDLGTVGIAGASLFFEKKLRAHSIEKLDQLYTVVCKSLVLVSIVLDRDDNPYLIFESLNAKGQPLTQSDLIRNFFFMRIHSTQQEPVFRQSWQPMQDRLGKHLTEFIRHYLMRDGRQIKQADVYFTVKEAVDRLEHDAVPSYLAEVTTFSDYYARLVDPSCESNRDLADRLIRLNRFEATTTYPFLLNVYHDFRSGRIPLDDFKSILDVLETFLIRRFVCGVSTRDLNKIFVALYAQVKPDETLLAGVQRLLAEKKFPPDAQFREQFATFTLYGGSGREKAKLILDCLEGSFSHKESINTVPLTIEHIMPQTLTEAWKTHLGPDWAETHTKLLDSVGNLTLTGYNSELSNSDFSKKQKLLTKSHVELNRYFADIVIWNAEAIEKRGEVLSEIALRRWPDFGPQRNEVEIDEEREDYSVYLEAVLEDLGGSVEQNRGRSIGTHRLPDGRIVNLKYSRPHGKYYWFGLLAKVWDELLRANGTHLVLVLHDTQYATIPVQVIKDYLVDAGQSMKNENTIRHYHLLVSTDKDPDLYHHGKPARFPLREYMRPFPKNRLSEKILTDSDIL